MGSHNAFPVGAPEAPHYVAPAVRLDQQSVQHNFSSASAESFTYDQPHPSESVAEVVELPTAAVTANTPPAIETAEDTNPIDKAHHDIYKQILLSTPNTSTGGKQNGTGKHSASSEAAPRHAAYEPYVGRHRATEETAGRHRAPESASRASRVARMGGKILKLSGISRLARDIRASDADINEGNREYTSKRAAKKVASRGHNY